jgi:uncharacterized protein
MGENRWRHEPSLDSMGTAQRFYLTTKRISKRFYALSTAPESPAGALRQRVDLADRTTQNDDPYPYLILGKQPDLSNGYAFLTAPFSRATEISGLDGVIRLRVNKRDLDVAIALYEMLPDGRLMQLTYYTERASFAQDMSHRALLTPEKEAVIPFYQDYLFSGLVGEGSRLLLMVNVSKNAFSEINYGTGKDVATESIKDAGAPMEVDWSTSSYVRLRLHLPDVAPRGDPRSP